jgi:Protein of unknown function (DUF1579)
MKTPTTTTLSAIALAGFFTTVATFADEKGAPDKPDFAKMQEMMKKVEAAGAPGEHHKALTPLIGEWKAEVKAYMSPDGPPMVSNGTSKTEWALDGRFVSEEFKGTVMGKPFHGMGLTGFDNLKQKYVSTWVDTMSTAIMNSEGTADEAKKVFTFTSKMDCPMTGEKDMPVKLVLRITSQDNHTFEMHDPRKGEKSKTMEITYTRK